MTTLRRGEACLNCKERRTRCDAARPRCGKCEKRDVECNYPELPKSADVLRRDVAALENRISELESRKAASPPVISLADPLWTPDGWWATDEPPMPLRGFLLNMFLQYSTTLGLFLSTERLTNSFHASAPFGHASRPSPALLSTIYLWGIILSGSQTLISQESIFLSRAIYHAKNSSGSGLTHSPIHNVQAEILIGYYFFRAGLIPEGQEHCATAFCSILTQGIHKIRGIELSQWPTSLDRVDQGERINAFWMAFLAETSMTCLYDLPSVCPDQDTEEGRIDLPWPLDMTQYEKGLMLPEIDATGTLANFLSNTVASYANEEISFRAMECKASTLLKRATEFAATWNPACTPEERAMFYAEFLTLNQRIDQFLETASPVLAYDNNSSRRFPLIIVHSLANLATIRLNVSSTWTTKSINAACAVVHLLDDFNLREIRFIHPMISKVWGIVGQVLIDEITRLRILDIATTTPDDRASEARLTNTLERLLKIVATFADGCSSMSIHFEMLDSKHSQLPARSDQVAIIHDS